MGYSRKERGMRIDPDGTLTLRKNMRGKEKEKGSIHCRTQGSMKDILN